MEHNQGIIDEKYLQRSNDKTYKLGQRIICKRNEVEKLIEIIKRLSTGISTMVDNKRY
ncbi:hypothetical protein ACTWQB_14270 [Piscibacillus sp. B03]|uniref:hypothetical protein n=1 Tax=Piscibacillus sp. B03 TaxID=3457430 RepID=UPI003FCD76AD